MTTIAKGHGVEITLDDGEYIIRRTLAGGGYGARETIKVKQITPMPPVRKLLWLAQLLSGGYRQAQRTLISPASNERRCCLGVLADLCPRVVYGTPKPSYPWTMPRDGATLKLAGERKGNTSMLTTGLKRWAGLTEGMQQLGAGLNDSGYTFRQIAFVIATLF
jgi:hypothetical protein